LFIVNLIQIEFGIAAKNHYLCNGICTEWHLNKTLYLLFSAPTLFRFVFIFYDFSIAFPCTFLHTNIGIFGGNVKRKQLENRSE